MLERLKRLMPTQETLRSSRWLRWLGPGLFHRRLWHMSRRGIALGVGIGVFFAFLIPVAQIPLSAAASVALRANIPAAVAATLVNNPVTFPAVYYAAWRVGNVLLGRSADETKAPVIPAASEVAANPDPRSIWQRSRQAVASVGGPLLLGALVFACVFGLLGYVVVNGAWHLRVRLKRRARLRRRVAA
jgi:uncharacterized protein (DUF2062 family)